MATVQDFDDFLTGLDSNARGVDHRDGLKWGEPAMEVRGVGATWMASMDVLHRAVAAGINLIVTHEPTFWFDGRPANPELERCRERDVDVGFKTRFLDEGGIAVIRAHDCWDRYPDYGVEARLRGVLGVPDPLEYLGGYHYFYEVAETTLGALAQDCKAKMDLPCLRVAGDLAKAVRKIVIAYGATSGTEGYYRFWRRGADAVISGEQSEWAAVRPAIDMGMGVIELGHAATEAFGMQGMADLLSEHFPNIPVRHLPTDPSFQWL